MAVIGRFNVTYRGGHEGKNTQWSVSESWVFSWGYLHDPIRGVVTPKRFQDRVRLEHTTPRLRNRQEGDEILGIGLTYSFVSTNSGMVRHVPFSILSPNDWMIIV